MATYLWSEKDGAEKARCVENISIFSPFQIRNDRHSPPVAIWNSQEDCLHNSLSSGPALTHPPRVLLPIAGNKKKGVDVNRQMPILSASCSCGASQRKTHDVCGSPCFLKPFKATVVRIASGSAASLRPYLGKDICSPTLYGAEKRVIASHRIDNGTKFDIHFAKFVLLELLDLKQRLEKCICFSFPSFFPPGCSVVPEEFVVCSLSFLMWLQSNKALVAEESMSVFALFKHVGSENILIFVYKCAKNQQVYREKKRTSILTHKEI